MEIAPSAAEPDLLNYLNPLDVTGTPLMCFCSPKLAIASTLALPDTSESNKNLPPPALSVSGFATGRGIIRRVIKSNVISMSVILPMTTDREGQT